MNRKTEEDKLTLLYISCENSRRTGLDKAQSLDFRKVCNTLLYQVYRQATEDDNNLAFLEACNEAFTHPKSKYNSNARNGDRMIKAGAVIARTIDRDETLPDFSVALQKLAVLLKRRIVITLDAVETLQQEDQNQLFDEIQTVVAEPDQVECAKAHVKFLIGCGMGESFQAKKSSMGSRYIEIDVGECNRGDMERWLSAALVSIQGLLPEEREMAKKAIIDQARKAGSSFRYIAEIGIPFMGEPFQGTINKHL